MRRRQNLRYSSLSSINIQLLSRFLNDTFGKCGRPTVSWQIDPFGHSSEAAIEFAEMGFEGLFVGRIDFEDFYKRFSTKSLETIWRPDPTLGM